LDYHPSPTFYENSSLAISSSRALRTLGWQARLDTGNAIDQAAQWYRAFSTGADHVGVMQAQISEALRSFGAA
jgi:dTDP-D-glucose 4,6-dehydratase